MNFDQQLKLVKVVNNHPKSKTLWKLIKGLKTLREQFNQTDDQIKKAVDAMNLDFREHMFILGQFSNLINLPVKWETIK